MLIGKTGRRVRKEPQRSRRFNAGAGVSYYTFTTGIQTGWCQRSFSCHPEGRPTTGLNAGDGTEQACGSPHRGRTFSVRSLRLHIHDSHTDPGETDSVPRACASFPRRRESRKAPSLRGFRTGRCQRSFSLPKIISDTKNRHREEAASRRGDLSLRCLRAFEIATVATRLRNDPFGAWDSGLGIRGWGFGVGDSGSESFLMSDRVPMVD